MVCWALQRIAQVGVGDAGVFAHQRLGTCAFAAHDRIDHGAVLLLGHDERVACTRASRLHHHEAVRRGERQRHRAFDLARHEVAAGHLHEQLVEAAVLLDVAGERLLAQFGLGEQGVDARQAVACLGEQHRADAAFGGESRGQALERAAHLDRVVNVGFGEVLDDEAAVRQRLEQALLLQAHQRHADRRARGLQALHERQLGDARAGFELAADDQLAQPQLGAYRLRDRDAVVRQGGREPERPAVRSRARSPPGDRLRYSEGEGPS